MTVALKRTMIETPAIAGKLLVRFVRRKIARTWDHAEAPLTDQPPASVATDDPEWLPSTPLTNW